MRFEKPQVLLPHCVTCSWRAGTGTNYRLDFSLHFQVAPLDALQTGGLQILLLQGTRSREQRFSGGRHPSRSASTFFANSSAALSSEDSVLSIAEAPPMILAYSA